MRLRHDVPDPPKVLILMAGAAEAGDLAESGLFSPKSTRVEMLLEFELDRAHDGQTLMRLCVFYANVIPLPTTIIDLNSEPFMGESK